MGKVSWEAHWHCLFKENDSREFFSPDFPSTFFMGFPYFFNKKKAQCSVMIQWIQRNHQMVITTTPVSEGFPNHLLFFCPRLLVLFFFSRGNKGMTMFKGKIFPWIYRTLVIVKIGNGDSIIIFMIIIQSRVILIISIGINRSAIGLLIDWPWLIWSMITNWKWDKN